MSEPRKAHRVHTSNSGRRYVDIKEVIREEMETIRRRNPSRAAELSRLERAVIEAAKAWRHKSAVLNVETNRLTYAETLNTAIDALIEFESQQV